MSESLLQNCNLCYQFYLSQLPTGTIVIKGNLAHNTNYILKVTDKFGNKFSTPPIETDSSGTLTVDVSGSVFPPQFFNRDAGSFYFEVSETAQPWQPATFTFDGFTTTCITVEFVNDNSGVNTIE